MKRAMYILAVFVALFFAPGLAYADVCSSIARAEAAKRPNVTLLNVQSVIKNNGKLICIATLRVDRKDGKPPRIVTRRFSP